MPDWLKFLGRMAETIFAPIGRLLGMSWQLFQWLLIGVAAILVLFAVWRLVGEPALTAWRSRRDRDDAEHWTPDSTRALALLEDAERLAQQGLYAEATHLLLHRSVSQIVEARPNWVTLASTAREISALPLLPEVGRQAFAVIADRVERAWFALRELDAGDWQAARSAYARFAQIELGA